MPPKWRFMPFYDNNVKERWGKALGFVASLKSMLNYPQASKFGGKYPTLLAWISMHMESWKLKSIHGFEKLVSIWIEKHQTP